ncbi:AraC family transcriptional regulator [Mumia xiangluensis]|uniref:AraC family transcriptional regulator n=1 Tax=Mumia xiangluensis TaxID=1678900 RepID=A0ABW1QIF8_9ACTN
MRSAGVKGFRAVVESLDGDPDALARRVGLDPAVLDEDDILVADWLLADLLEESAHALACPDLGLRMAARHGLDLLGPLAIVLVNSPTTGEALAGVARYLRFHADTIHVGLGPDPSGAPETAAFSYAQDVGAEPPVQAMDAGIGFVHRTFVEITGPGYGLRSIHLSYEPVAPLTAYEDFFGVPVVTGAATTYLRIPADFASTPIAGADEANRARAMAYLESVLPPELEDFPGRTRAIVHETLAFVPPQMSHVARILNVGERTLQRRLAERGTGFAQIVDDVRRETVHRYLTRTSMPLHEISAAVGFAEQATLTRSARRWWGQTPRAVRHGTT